MLIFMDINNINILENAFKIIFVENNRKKENFKWISMFVQFAVMFMILQ